MQSCVTSLQIYINTVILQIRDLLLLCQESIKYSVLLYLLVSMLTVIGQFTVLSRTLLNGPLKCRVGPVAKLFCDVLQVKV